VPVVVVAYTVKGRGVSFMEGDAGWHGKAPNAEQTAAALAELDAVFAAAEVAAGPSMTEGGTR
jgi:transketolase